MPDRATNDPASAPATFDVTYVMPIVMYEAWCSCGWRQLHETSASAEADADEHKQEAHRD